MRIPEHPTEIRRLLDARRARLAPGKPVLAATLTQVRKRCGQPSCRCYHGQPSPAPQGRPSLSVGPALARTLRHFFPDFTTWLDQLPDPRCPQRIIYPRRFLGWYGVLLFVGKLGRRRQLDFKYREKGTAV